MSFKPHLYTTLKIIKITIQLLLSIVKYQLVVFMTTFDNALFKKEKHEKDNKTHYLTSIDNNYWFNFNNTIFILLKI